jgi:hypothetical protein
MLGRDKYVLGIDSVLKASGQSLPLSSRAEVGHRSQCVPKSFTGSEHDGAASTAPRAAPHHRAATVAVLPALAARALRVAAPATMSGRGGLWSEVAGRAHMGTRVGTFTFRLTVALGAAARDSAAFCRASHWGEFSAIHCSASFSQLNIAPSISCLRACPQVTKATQPRRFERGETSK